MQIAFEMSNPVSWEQNKKNILIRRLLKIVLSVLSVNVSLVKKTSADVYCDFTTVIN